MIRPREGYVLAKKAKDTSRGYEVEIPGAYENVETGKVFYCTSIELEIPKPQHFIIRKDAIVADDV